jgi:hypothetical protein
MGTSRYYIYKVINDKEVFVVAYYDKEKAYDIAERFNYAGAYRYVVKEVNLNDR